MLTSTWAGAQTGEAAAGSEETESQQADPEAAWAGVEEFFVIGVASAFASDLGTADSVIAWSEEDLLAFGAQDLSDLATFTPNLEIVTAGATAPTFFIRGVGLNDFNPNSTGAVAIYQDGVAINAPAMQLGPLFDLETVTVLRGPQGTGLGRNASAGAIKVYSRKPSGDFGGYLRVDFGNYDSQEYEGALEAPILPDLLSARIAFKLVQRDGTMRNRCAGAPPMGQRAMRPAAATATQGPWSICGEPVLQNQISTVPTGLEKYVNNTDNWAARGTMLFQPNPEMSWLLNAHGSRRDELTRLGQSIGTGGLFCTDGEICSPPLGGVPPELLGQLNAGVLGGAQNAFSLNSGYQPQEIRAQYEALAPCLVATDFLDACFRQSTQDRVAANRAKIKVANQLARELDSAPWKGDFDHTGKTRNETWGAYLQGDIDLPGEIQLKTTTAFDRYRRRVSVDLDFSPATLFHITTSDRAWQVYQDVSLSGEYGYTAPLTWEIGGWVLREELDALVNNDFGTTLAAMFGTPS